MLKHAKSSKVCLIFITGTYPRTHLHLPSSARAKREPFNAMAMGAAICRSGTLAGGLVMSGGYLANDWVPVARHYEITTVQPGATCWNV